MQISYKLVLLFILVSFYSKADSDTSNVSRKKTLDFAKACIDQDLYSLSENTLKKYLIFDSTDAEFYYELGMLEFTFLVKNDSAIKYLEKSLQHEKDKKDSLPEICFALGQSYQFVENYDKALKFYFAFNRRLKGNEGGDSLKNTTDRYINQCNYAKENTKLAKRITITNVGPAINTSGPEYDPVITGSDNILFFTSVRFEKKKDSETYDTVAFPKIYVSNKKDGYFRNSNRFRLFDSLESVSSSISAGSISYTNNQFFVCKDNRIYKSSGKDTSWGMPILIGDSVNMAFLQDHAFLSPDEKTLYFAGSNLESFGGLDIYKCIKKNDGRWGKAINLGPKINTPFDEEGPWVSNSGKTFYFSSKGHLGFGGFDIFKSNINDTTFSIPENMGRPFNSSADDMFLKFNKAGDIGYLSSGRNNGFGDMDIYEVSKGDECKTIKNKTYSVTIDASNSIDRRGVKLNYEWNMDDGSIENGIKVTHLYKRPGIYNVCLNSVEQISKQKNINDTTVSVIINNVSHIEFVCPDTIYQNDTVKFDGSSSMIKDKTAIKFLWKMEKENFGNGGPQALFIFQNPGIYGVNMQVKFNCKDCEEIESYCYSKSVTVLPKINSNK